MSNVGNKCKYWPESGQNRSNIDENLSPGRSWCQEKESAIGSICSSSIWGWYSYFSFEFPIQKCIFMAPWWTPTEGWVMRNRLASRAESRNWARCKSHEPVLTCKNSQNGRKRKMAITRAPGGLENRSPHQTIEENHGHHLQMVPGAVILPKEPKTHFLQIYFCNFFPC